MSTVTVEKPTGQELVLSDQLSDISTSLAKGGVSLTPLGMTFIKGITDKAAAQIGSAIIRVDQVMGVARNFWLGDYYNWLTKQFPRKAQQIIEGLPEYKYETLKNNGYIAAQIPLELRSQELNWTLYTRLAPCDAGSIVKTLKAFKEGTLDFDGVVKFIDDEQKKRVQKDREATRKKVEGQQKEASKDAEVDTQGTDTAETPAPPKEERIGIVIRTSTFKKLQAAEKQVRKVLKSKSKLEDADTLEYVLTKFCAVNKLKVDGLVVTDADSTGAPEPESDPESNDEPAGSDDTEE